MSYTATRREEEKERRRQEILDAALKLYAEHGWDAVTMDQVARQARLSRALVYVYFKDKDELLYAIAELAMTDMIRRFRAASARHAKGLDQAEAMGRAYIDFARETPHFFDACSRFQGHVSETERGPHENACNAANQEIHVILRESLERGFEDGSIRRDIGNPDTICVALWAFTHGLIQLSMSKANEIGMLGVGIEQLREQSIAMLRYTLAARPAG